MQDHVLDAIEDAVSRAMHGQPLNDDGEDQDRLQLRELLLAGAATVAAEPVSEAYFEGLRQRVRAAGKARGKS